MDIKTKREIARDESPEEVFFKLIQYFPDAILLIRARDWNIIQANPPLEMLTGYSIHELIDQPVINSQLWHDPKLWDIIKSQIPVMQGHYYVDTIIMKKDGELAYVMMSIHQIEIVDELSFMVLIQDITHHKEAAENLQNALVNISQLRAHLESVKDYLQEEIRMEHDFNEIIGRSSKFKKVLRLVEQVASSDVTVLITGETGTGKELIARAIHGISDRKDQPLVKVNCAALPGALIESELFGYERGAFTGATSRKLGRFELADKGTLLLDEIGELPLELQAKLLRVLQEKEFERLGGVMTIRADVRVIAVTNRDPNKLIASGRFRQDLYHRLNIFPIHIPPLREHKDDIPPLVNYFLFKYARKFGEQFELIPRDMLSALMAYDWPGNVRELENIIERSVIISHGKYYLSLGDWLPKSPNFTSDNQSITLEEVEKRHILKILSITKWRVSGEKGAAKILGLNPKTLYSKMQKLQIKPPKENSDI
jgi:formate hydrogenlyase transcriptional activator